MSAYPEESITNGDAKNVCLGDETERSVHEQAEEEMRKELEARGEEYAALASTMHDTSDQDVKQLDEYIMIGVQLFLNNSFEEAEKHLKDGFQLNNDPLCLVAAGCVAIVRAMCTFRPEDVNIAKDLAIQAYYAADAILPKEGIGARVYRMFTRKPKVERTMFQLRAMLAKSEASNLQALAFLLSENFVNLVKASMASRHSYNLLMELEAHPQRAEMVPEVSDGVALGVGLSNLIISTLPAKLLRIVSFLGYPHDRKRAEELLQSTVESGGIRCVTAYMILFLLYGVIPSHATILMKKNVPRALELAERYLNSHPKSVLLMWLIGRVYRMTRDVPKSLSFFNQSIESVQGKGPFQVLANFAMYDKAWSHCCLFEWEAALACYDELLVRSSWTPAFYAYAAGACLEALGRTEEARARYLLAPTLIKRKIMGRTISVEQYIQMRVRGMQCASAPDSTSNANSQTSTACPLAIWELMYLFTLFPQIPHENLKQMVTTLDTYRTPSMQEVHSSWCVNMSVVQLLQACAHFEIGNTNDAQSLLQELIHNISPGPSDPVWLLPHALYEVTSNEYLSGDTESANQNLQKLLQTVQQSPDFNFEFFLQLRLHLLDQYIKSK